MPERPVWSPGRAQLAVQITLPSEGVPASLGLGLRTAGGAPWRRGGETKLHRAPRKSTMVEERFGDLRSCGRRGRRPRRTRASRCSSMRSRRSWRRRVRHAKYSELALGRRFGDLRSCGRRDRRPAPNWAMHRDVLGPRRAHVRIRGTARPRSPDLLAAAARDCRFAKANISRKAPKLDTFWPTLADW
jgi:hypothetical protein